jgi:hypothetical protein
MEAMVEIVRGERNAYTVLAVKPEGKIPFGVSRYVYLEG